MLQMEITPKKPSHLFAPAIAATLLVVAPQRIEAEVLASNLASASSPSMTTGSYLATDFITGNASSAITGASFKGFNYTTLNFYNPSGGNILIGYSLYTDNAGKPGTYIPDSSFGVTVPAPNFSGQTFSFPANITLTANTIYWLVATVTDTTATMIDPLNPPAAMGGPGQAPLGTGGFYQPVPGTMNQYAASQMQAMTGNWSDIPSTDLAFEFTGTIGTMTTDANLIRNPGFESPPVPGGAGSYESFGTGSSLGGVWRVEATEQGVVVIANDRYPFHHSTDGAQFLYLGNSWSASTLVQDIATPLQGGRKYLLSFQQSAFTDGFPDENYSGRVIVELRPTAGGDHVFIQEFTVPAFSPWVGKTAVVPVPASGSYSLVLRSFNNQPAVIDKLRLIPAPELQMATLPNGICNSPSTACSSPRPISVTGATSSPRRPAPMSSRKPRSAEQNSSAHAGNKFKTIRLVAPSRHDHGDPAGTRSFGEGILLHQL